MKRAILPTGNCSPALVDLVTALVPASLPLPPLPFPPLPPAIVSICFFVLKDCLLGKACCVQSAHCVRSLLMLTNYNFKYLKYGRTNEDQYLAQAQLPFRLPFVSEQSKAMSYEGSRIWRSFRHVLGV